MRRALSTISSAVAAAAPRSGGITPDQRANVDRAFLAYTASLEESLAKRDEGIVKARVAFAVPAASAVATVVAMFMDSVGPVAMPIGCLITGVAAFVPAVAYDAVDVRHKQRCDEAEKLYELRKRHALIEDPTLVEEKM